MLTRRQAILLTASATLPAGAWPGRADDAAPLRIGGTGSAQELMTTLAEEYRKASGKGYVVLPALGSSGGIQALRDRALDIAISARPLKPEEAGGLAVVPFARSPFAFVSSHPNPGGATIARVASMFADPQSKWPDGAPVRCILRPRAESDTALVARLFPAVGAAIELARTRTDVPVAVSDLDNATMAERIEGSLTAISLCQARLEKRNLRVIELDGQAPSLASLEQGRYPHGRDLLLAHDTAASAHVQGFLAFIRSADGARLLRRSECLPLT